MKNFGYSISPDRQLDYDLLKRDVYTSLVNAEPSVKGCISCGCCAATCSAGQFINFSLRRIILQLRRGESTEALRTIGQCMLCGKCQMLCPMGVNTRNVIWVLMQTAQSKQVLPF